MRGARVLWGRAHEAAGAPPYWPWVQAARRATRARTASMEVARRGSVRAIRRRAARASSRGCAAALPRAADPPIVDPEAAQFRLFDAYAQFLRAIASEAPLVVVLDDLHWADKPTLLLLQHVARELARMRVLVVGNYRDTDIARQRPLSETLAALNRESWLPAHRPARAHRRTRSARTSARAAQVAARSPRRAARIFEETEGNAFFLARSST